MSDNWRPLPGVTRIGTWPLAKSVRWTWRDTLLIVPGTLLVVLALPFLSRK